jgi:EpsI family protein
MEDIENEGREKNDGRKAGRLFQPVFIVAIVLLGSTLVLSKGIEFRQKVPISKPFSQFPMQVGEWQGTRERMEQEFLDVLKFSDYIMTSYKNPQGKTINFYVAYYQDQRKGESIHSPETCLPGSDWEFKEAGATAIPMPKTNPGSITVNRAFMEKAGQRELVYYWFPMRGRILTNLYQLKIYNFWDALTRQRTDGALVRVITPLYPGESTQDAEVRLQEFTGEVVPVLKGYIPE